MMLEYHKINSIYKRDPQTKKFIEGQYSCPEFEYLKDNKWIWTEKIDGTNIRINWTISSLTIGGKTDRAQIPSHLVNKLTQLFNEEKFITVFPDVSEGFNVTLYGEGYGIKIQNGGKYIPDGVDFVLFDININGTWLKREDVENIATKFGIRVVPIIGSGTIQEAIELVRKGFKSTWGDFIAEGLVLRPEVELKARIGYRIITKVKHCDFI